MRFRIQRVECGDAMAGSTDFTTTIKESDDGEMMRKLFESLEPEDSWERYELLKVVSTNGVASPVYIEETFDELGN